jgi:hypothetical protein
VDHDCSAETIYQLKDATFTPNTSSSSSSSSSSSTAICLAYDFDENKITNLDDLDIFANLWRNKTDISLTSKETFTTTLRNYLNKLKGLDYSDILKLEKDMTPCGIQSELNS